MQTIKHKLAALLALVIFALTPGATLAADVSSASGVDLPEITVSKPYNWTGAYVGGGAGFEATGLDDGTGVQLSDDSGFGYGRLGYRYQAGGRLVLGVFVEGNVSALDVDKEIEATYSALVGGDIGLALGGLLISIEGGFGKTFVEGDNTADPEGPFVGIKMAIDLGDGFELNAGGRARIEDEGKIDFDKTGAMIGLGYRF